MIKIILLLSLVLVCRSATKPGIIVTTLQQKYYNPSTGLWVAPAGWWNSGNSLEAISEYMTYTSDHTYLNVLDNTYQHTSLKQTENGYFDDAQWWGIAWTRAYELTKKSEFLQRAEEIWNYVLTAWDNKCNGGVWWSSARNYKNAIPNELFLVYNTLLYKNTNNNTYLQWAMREWNWFESTGMINSHNLVNDGLDGNCRNNGQQTWTYNQGVILGGLANLYTITNNQTLMEIGKKIASATINTLVYSDSGILKEPCESSGSCGNDAPQFKGVFTRYLGQFTTKLTDQDPEKNSYKQFLTKNADSIWNSDRNSENECGLKWIGPSTQTATATTQTSALDTFNSQYLVGN